MAADVPVKHEKRHAEDKLRQRCALVVGCVLVKSLLAGISYTPDNCVSVAFCYWLVCEPAKGEEFVALNRINVSQPVAPASSMEVKHPPLFIPPP